MWLRERETADREREERRREKRTRTEWNERSEWNDGHSFSRPVYLLHVDKEWIQRQGNDLRKWPDGEGMDWVSLSLVSRLHVNTHYREIPGDKTRERDGMWVNCLLPDPFTSIPFLSPDSEIRVRWHYVSPYTLQLTHILTHFLSLPTSSSHPVARPRGER